MTVKYRTDGPVTVDEDVDQLHKYHPDIEELIAVDLHGLTGRGPEIHRIVVQEELDESEQTALEDYLNASIEQIPDDPS